MSKPHDNLLEARRSCQLKPSPNGTNSPWKSDICINNKKGSYTIIKTATGSNLTEAKHRHKDYYKRYEHDEVPVKDNVRDTRNPKSPSPERGGDTKKSFTNSDLDRLEQNIYKNLSQELQIEDKSTSSLESNIKFFKATVQEIFDNFQSNMRDFELYKKKLAEILDKTQAESMADMENFIKEMIQNIISTDSSAQSIKTTDTNVQVEVQDGGTDAMKGFDSRTETITTNATSEGASYDESVHLIVEAYKNDNYLTDSTLNENNSKLKNHAMDKGGLNVYLLSTPCVIKMNNRSLLSEINIKDSNTDGVSSYVASTENIKKMAAKKMEMEEYELRRHEMSDREIPVKVSFAKKNLCGDEGSIQKDMEDSSKSFISKICSYICKKFRKNTIG